MTDIAHDKIEPVSRGGSLDEPAEVSPQRSLFSRDFKQTFFYCLRLFIAVRVLLGLLALLASALLEQNTPINVPGWAAPAESAGWHNLVTAWERWDALWFLRIATEGYADNDLSAAFFPLYPLLVRGVTVLIGGHALVAALIVSNVAFFGALLTVFELTRELFDRAMAKRVVLYLAIFPTAYFFVAPYTESLFLLLSAGAFLAAHRRRWEWAGLCGALAAGTRSIGLILVLPLLLQALAQWRERSSGKRIDKELVTSLAWSGFVAVGTLSYLLFWERFAGDWLTPLDNQNGWLREFSFVWTSYARGTQEAFRFIGQFAGGYHQLDWIFVTVGIVVVVWLWRKVPLAYWVYAVLSLLVPMSFIFEGRPFMSMPRFILPIFPIFWGLAMIAEKLKIHDLIVTVSAAGLGILTVLFVNWYFVF